MICVCPHDKKKEPISQFDVGTGDLLSRSEDLQEGALENRLLEVGWFGHQQALVDQERSIGRSVAALT
jgi:hypothetical protein